MFESQAWLRTTKPSKPPDHPWPRQETRRVSGNHGGQLHALGIFPPQSLGWDPQNCSSQDRQCPGLCSCQPAPPLVAATISQARVPLFREQGGAASTLQGAAGATGVPPCFFWAHQDVCWLLHHLAYIERPWGPQKSTEQRVRRAWDSNLPLALTSGTPSNSSVCLESNTRGALPTQLDPQGLAHGRHWWAGVLMTVSLRVLHYELVMALLPSGA